MSPVRIKRRSMAREQTVTEHMFSISADSIRTGYGTVIRLSCDATSAEPKTRVSSYVKITTTLLSMTFTICIV